MRNFVLAIVLLLLAQFANATIVVTTTNFNAGPPATAKPAGKYTVPATRIKFKYKIEIDYVVYDANGNVQLYNSNLATEVLDLGFPNPGTHDWSSNVTTTIGTPAGVHVRARLFMFDPGRSEWVKASESIVPLQ